jgi:hypothetical protein
MTDGVQRLIEVHGPMSAVVFRLMVVLSILVQATPSRAQKTVGYGETSCQSWTKERRSETAMSLAYSGWILGFVSGVNAIHILMVDQDFLKTAVAKGMVAWVDDHCAAHPDDNLDSAAMALISALKENVRQKR